MAAPESNRLLNAINPELLFSIASSLCRPIVLRPIATRAMKAFGRRGKLADHEWRADVSTPTLLDRQSHFACCVATRLTGAGRRTRMVSRLRCLPRPQADQISYEGV